MRITGAKVFDAQKGFEERDLYVEHDKIVAHSDGGPTVDAAGCYVIPGLTDLHFHGCMGEDFSDGNAAGFQKMADYDTAKAAFDNGAKEITHLFNAMPPFNHRAPGVIGAGADDPHAMAEIISDGIHI
ncbi:MAG: hypothetical protein RSG86_04715, partial [Oscillospiraceae bacterium]